MHEHKDCEHKKLEFCKQCDQVYCNACKKEWRYNFGSITYTTGTGTWPYINGSTTLVNNATGTCNPGVESTLTNNHAHTTY